MIIGFDDPELAEQVRPASTFKTVTACIGCFVAILLGWHLATSTPSPYTDYSAVRLTNGETYYGHLSGLGSQWPVMTEVFTISGSFNAGTGTMGATITPQANALHGPERTILNRDQILFVETVSAGSQVGQLIKATTARAK